MRLQQHKKLLTHLLALTLVNGIAGNVIFLGHDNGVYAWGTSLYLNAIYCFFLSCKVESSKWYENNPSFDPFMVAPKLNKIIRHLNYCTASYMILFLGSLGCMLGYSHWKFTLGGGVAGLVLFAWTVYLTTKIKTFLSQHSAFDVVVIGNALGLAVRVGIPQPPAPDQNHDAIVNGIPLDR